LLDDGSLEIYILCACVISSLENLEHMHTTLNDAVCPSYHLKTEVSILLCVQPVIQQYESTAVRKAPL